MSTHPIIGGEPVPGFGRNSLFLNALTSVEEDEQEMGTTYFPPAPRSNSPEPMESQPVEVAPKISMEAAPIRHSSPTPSFSLPWRNRNNPNLAAPSPILRGGSPGIRSLMEGGSEDVDSISLNNSVDSFSIPKPPLSPFAMIPRSPSMASERSVNSVTGLPRPFNYSRPISRARVPSIDMKRFAESPYRQDSGQSSSTRPSLDVPVRSDSGDSPLTPLTNDAPQTPVSISSDEFFNFNVPQSDGPSSYIYTKYSIPKGKRVSIGVEEFFNRHINWNEQSSIEAEPVLELTHVVGPQSLPSPALTESPPKSRRRDRPADIAIPRNLPEELNSSPKRKTHKSRPSSPSTLTSDASTIKARLVRSKQTSSELTPEMHLEKGIECHEVGSLQESTYHFRLAAKAGLSDAMLLYALACRHGWGMRPNPAEAISWLQKAVNSTQLEVAEDEATAKQGKNLDAIDRAKHKAQFALGVYELGMSYMKGWGVQQDKALALRCFEVAGSWGDVDALSEAGFCYTEGVGCKKDMKKAARFYRLAETKGVSMAGNSW
jgi:hypothetical protein